MRSDVTGTNDPPVEICMHGCLTCRLQYGTRVQFVRIQIEEYRINWHISPQCIKIV
jgi:hypothetical protein